MRRLFLIAVFIITALSTTLAGRKKYPVYIIQPNVETIDDVVAMNDSTPHITTFYGIEKIVVNNTKNVLIRVYNDKWKLILETNDNIDMKVTPGNYYIACANRIKCQYVVR